MIWHWRNMSPSGMTHRGSDASGSHWAAAQNGGPGMQLRLAPAATDARMVSTIAAVSGPVLGILQMLETRPALPRRRELTGARGREPNPLLRETQVNHLIWCTRR
jgi:hypothetical protein